MKIVSLGDIHIRNFKYLEEYKEVFEKFYIKLSEIKPDVILILGDLAHTKNNLSSEYFDITSNFLKRISSYCPVHMILGNHDCVLSNIKRQDAISPIVNALENPNLFLHKKSKEIDIGENIVLNVFSIIDKDNWIKVPRDKKKINIALYHGAILGSETDLGWKIKHANVDLETFKDFDYGIFGDIHKENQILDLKGAKRYIGSFIQQNHSESNNKGFLIWDIKGKEEFEVEHVVLKNPSPFVTLELTKKGRVPKNVKINKNSKIRVVSYSNIPFDAIKRSMDIVKQRFKPESVTFISRVAEGFTNSANIINTSMQENLRDVGVQEKLIEEFLKGYEIEKELLEKVFELNRNYDAAAQNEEEIIRNINWELRNVKWNNLFNYGKGNEIDFSSLQGIVGIFGKNFSGKSSIIDNVLYTIYNSISKRATKNLNIINQNKNYGQGKVKITIGDDEYNIERRSEKYEKKLKGKTTIEASTSVDFYKIDGYSKEKVSLNGNTRIETDNKIRKMFGSLDDFLLTSMSSQFGSQIYINEGSTKRKEILAKFLDLEVFDKKYRLAKEDAADLKGALKRLEGNDFDLEIKDGEKEFEQKKKELEIQKEECKCFKECINVLKKEILELQHKINQIPTELIEIDRVLSGLNSLKVNFRSLKREKKVLKQEIRENKEKYVNIEDFLTKTFDIEEIKEKKEEINENNRKIDKIVWDIEREKKNIEDLSKKSKSLSEVPCGNGFPQCPFIKSAHKSAKRIVEREEKINLLKNQIEEIRKHISTLEPSKIDERIEKYELLLEKKNELNIKINQQELEKQKNKNSRIIIQQEMDVLEEEKRKYEQNKELIKSLKQVTKEKKEKEEDLKKNERLLKNCDEEIFELIKQCGSCEQKIEDLKDKKDELLRLRKEFEAYDLYLRCMHNDGITYDIIKRRLPFINNEISKILANVVDFEVFFESDGKKLNIFVKYPRYDSRPLEMGSGAEKDIAAMAIRMALLSVSSLPKSDFFVLDEPGGSLDGENAEGFIRILDIIKSKFKNVFLISHLDFLKDVVDSQIVIGKSKRGYALVNHKED